MSNLKFYSFDNICKPFLKSWMIMIWHCW